VSGAEANDELLQQLEEEFSTLKVNWFPGHMVKATKVIREKLKQVDMVFEVRDARIPFTSANDDLDKIVGPSKARLIVLNKADLSNQALEQRVLQRFKEQGKTAVYACGRTGANVNKLLTWARERGARRGEFSTTGAVAMVVGMPNVGKSSLINLLPKQNLHPRPAKQVARVGAMPGVTRQVSAFRIGSTPPLYLVDTPGVMVPRVNSVTAGLCLALTRAVPDSVVPPDILVGFMLRVVRSRRLHGAKGAKGSLACAGEGVPHAAARRPRQQPRRSKAIIAWLLDLEGGAGPDADISDALVPSRPPVSDGDGGGTGSQGGTAARTDTPNRQQPPSPREQQPHRHRFGSDDELTHFGGSPWRARAGPRGSRPRRPGGFAAGTSWTLSGTDSSGGSRSTACHACPAAESAKNSPKFRVLSFPPRRIWRQRQEVADGGQSSSGNSLLLCPTTVTWPIGWCGTGRTPMRGRGQALGD
ncbi:unnamed protein product, partial [Scytosiphon promiscuus]